MTGSIVAATGVQGQQKHAVVVGAGPAGALAALHLAQLGFRVGVYEKRQPEHQGPAEGSSQGADVGASTTLGKRTYNVVLSERALLALERVGVALPKGVAAHYHVAFLHKQQGSPTDGRPRKRTGRGVVVNRGALASALVQRCAERYPKTIEFHFGQQLTGLDSAACMARFGPVEGGEEVEVAYDLLVGADGANSRTRALLSQQDPDLKVEQNKNPNDYKPASLGPARAFLPGVFEEAAGSVHAWVNRKAVGGDAQIIGAAAGDGQLLTVLILKRGVHESIGDEAGYRAFLSKTFPTIPAAVVESMAQQLVAVPPSVGGISTRCTKLYSGRVVLVGDAAHSAWPTLGHGANSALECAEVLATALEEAGGAQATAGQLEAALATYSARRLPDARAVVELSEQGFKVPLLFPQMLAQMLLHKLAPFLVPEPAFLLLHSSAQPYSTLQRRMRAEAAAFKVGMAAAGLAAVASLGRALLR